MTDRKDVFDLLQRAEPSLFEKLLAEPDQEGITDCAKQLGVYADGEVVLGSEDETGALLDYYLFEDKSQGETTRMQEFIAAPTDELNTDERALLAFLDDTVFGIFKLQRGDEDAPLYIRNVVDDTVLGLQEREMIPPECHVDDLMGIRAIVDEDENAWVVGFPLIIPRKTRKFFSHKGAILELAGLIKQVESEELDTAALLRAIIASRVTEQLAAESGQKIKVKKPKRSLARKKRRKKK